MSSRQHTRMLATVIALLAMVPVTAAAQTARWTLRETLRIGGADSGVTAFISVRALDADARGRILVLERRTQDIRVFAPDGKHVRTIGRIGSGPGEMRNAEGMVIARDGRIWVRDAANARFTVFEPDGDFYKGWTTKFCWSQGTWNPQLDQRGRIIDWDCVVEPGRGRRDVVLAYRTDLSGVDTVSARPECGTRQLSEAGTWILRAEKSTSYISIPFAPFPIGVLGPLGEVWCAPNSSRYEIERLVASGKDTIRISRNVAARPVTRSERDSIISANTQKGPSPLDFDRIPRTKPVIDRIIIDDQGRPWVKRTTPQGSVVFDVYDAVGKPVATVEFEAAVRNPTFLPFVVRGNAVYTVVLDDDDLQYVARFEIMRR